MLYGNSYYYAYHAQRRHQAAKEVDIYILNQEEFLTMWIYAQKDLGKSPAQIKEKLDTLTGVELINSTLEIAKNHAALARDLALLSVLARDLMRSGGLLTEYYTTIRNGQEYIVFKGNHRLRRVIRGTRYLASNTQMVKLGIGGKGIRAAAKTSFVITAFMSLTLRTYEWFFKEEYRWAHWVSNLGADLIKVAIAGVSGSLAAMTFVAVAGGSVAVLIPVAIGITVGLLVGYTLKNIDTDDRLANYILSAIENSEKRVDRVTKSVGERVDELSERAIKSLGTEARRMISMRVSIYRQRLLGGGW